ncbi:MAG: hypothetical protein IGR76_16620 [Synechococcales cyanobacterium T60_A2020_003]|nr:hypothetical protein [Synechococcales cyanobacterium T60_A2020_003]
MKKPLKSAELFLTLGLTAALGACGSPTPTTNESPAADVAPAESPMETHSEGGEGGEGGESGASSGDADVDYMTALGLMKGHLIVAAELMDLERYDEAQPHIAHPVDELYADIEGQLDERGVTEFKTSLNELNDLAKSAPSDPKMEEAFETSIASIDSAIEAIPPEQRQSPEFVLTVINGLLAVAAEEYEAAIADDKFVELVEYQDSRGFVIYAETLYTNIASQMQQERPDDHAAIMNAMTELKTVWPAVEPPATPVKTPEEVYGLVSQVELHS